ncbi:molybdopterin molybdotransferase MoeA [Ottowia testudinis]|uniref:Molybdopterin molybdenumtransferase n=1 Tax=Ottowia testudinis TaxID=2816950 RepID=A0A975CCZ2_9BURK|nr:gephyrin-like molybdotransferase Glp [Ottowia testudinis]QTD43990.1 molybdopterin molybdotransferase MoeA [Ottowia testudinis]
MADPSPRPPLMPLDEALQRLLAHAVPLGRTEDVDTFSADGRVLAQDVVSALQVPPHANTSMDGYALRAADIATAGTVLPVTQRIPAGRAGEPLAPGSAARIYTGAPLPDGADAVVMQEEAEALDDGARVRINVPPTRGQWVRPAGEDVQRGAVILQKGERLAPAALGLTAGIGLNQLRVSARPRVALFSTGDELVMPGAIPPERLPAGAIYNSNRYFLNALLLRLGCQVTDFGSVPDRRDATLLAIKSAAREHDLIVTSGGVSVGDEDHIKPALQRLGTLEMWQIAMKPGKPFAYGQIRRGAQGDAPPVHFMGLPGNPVSSFVTFLLLVRPFVLQLQGMRDVLPRAVAMRADFTLARTDTRREFLRARRNEHGGLELFPNQSSGVLTSMHWADGFIDHPAGASILRGDMVRFIALSDLLA